MSGPFDIDAPAPHIGKMLAAPAAIEAAPRLRVEFALDAGHGEVAGATLLLSALGVVEAWLNGAPVNDDLLAPGWTSYEWRVRYTASDVTGLVSAGANAPRASAWRRLVCDPALQSAACDLWRAAGRLLPSFTFALPTGTGRSWRRTETGLRVQVRSPGRTSMTASRSTRGLGARTGCSRVLRQRDGGPPKSSTSIAASSTASLSPRYGASRRARRSGCGHRLEGSSPCRLRPESGRLAPRQGPGRQRRHTDDPSCRGSPENDELGVRPLRSAKATDIYTLSGGEDLFEPTLVFHGFRYAEIDGWPDGIDALAQGGGVEAVVIGSDMKRTGWFRCSNDDLNQLHDNVVWSTRAISSACRPTARSATS